MGVKVGVGVSVCVGVDVGSGVSVSVDVGDGTGVFVAFINCPEPHPKSRMLNAKVHMMVVIRFTFILPLAITGAPDFLSAESMLHQSRLRNDTDRSAFNAHR